MLSLISLLIARMLLTIPHDHPSLPGHFPGRPVVPGVVVLERVLAAIEAEHGPLPALRLPQVKFQRPLLPGEQARIHLEQPAPGRWRFQVLCGDAVVASGAVASAAVIGGDVAADAG